MGGPNEHRHRRAHPQPPLSPTTVAAHRWQFLKGVRVVVPMHYGTFPALAGTPQELRDRLTRKDVNVTQLAPGEALTLDLRSVRDLF